MKVATIPVGSIGTNCYIVSDGNGTCAVVDPGAQPAKLVAYLEGHKLDCKAILLTHGHYDHIGAVKALMARFPAAALYIGEEDAPMLSDTQLSLAVFRYESDDNYIIGPCSTVREGMVVQAGEMSFEVIGTPGHTKGGVCYRCGAVLFSGDTLFQDNVGRCDLPGGSYPTLLESLKKIAALEGDPVVYPGHGPSTTLDYERRNNRYIHQAAGKGSSQ